jgi:hypothetical protein
MVILRTCPSANLICTPGLNAAIAEEDAGTERAAVRRHTPLRKSVLVNLLIEEVKAVVEDALIEMEAAASPVKATVLSAAARAMERTSAFGAPLKRLIDMQLLRDLILQKASAFKKVAEDSINSLQVLSVSPCATGRAT